MNKPDPNVCKRPECKDEPPHVHGEDVGPIERAYTVVDRPPHPRKTIESYCYCKECEEYYRSKS